MAEQEITMQGGGARPVVQFRLPKPIYVELKTTAAKKGLTISQEGARRIERLPEYEKYHAEAQDFLEEVKKGTADNIRQLLRKVGYTPIRTIAGIFWAEPGVSPDAVPKPSLDPEAVAVIEKAVEEALEKILGPAAERILERAIKKTKAPSKAA